MTPPWIVRQRSRRHRRSSPAAWSWTASSRGNCAGTPPLGLHAVRVGARHDEVEVRAARRRDEPPRPTSSSLPRSGARRSPGRGGCMTVGAVARVRSGGRRGPWPARRHGRKRRRAPGHETRAAPARRGRPGRGRGRPRRSRAGGARQRPAASGMMHPLADGAHDLERGLVDSPPCRRRLRYAEAGAHASALRRAVEAPSPGANPSTSASMRAASSAGSGATSCVASSSRAFWRAFSVASSAPPSAQRS